MTFYLCPVCGYDRLEEPPLDHEICPCCGTHFGYHDAYLHPIVLRVRWINAGKPWFDSGTPKPIGWNPDNQLHRAGFDSWQMEVDTKSNIATKIRGSVGDAEATYLADVAA